MLKPLTVWITTNCGKFLKGWKYRVINNHRTGKYSFVLVPKKGNVRYSDYCTIALISNASKVMLKILQARLENFQMFKPDLEKAEEPEIKLPQKQRHYFANKGPSSQGYGFSSSHVWL